ncbi:MAG: hypothetical protein GY820_30365 [Gammaproteobacteria bacterium]|nr:hypothetical protein [Gammaproteobacteria bacterium]
MDGNAWAMFRQSQQVRNSRPTQAKIAYESNNRHKKMVVDYLGSGADEELLNKVVYFADGDCWEVVSTSNDGKTYIVQKIKDHCTCARTLIHCDILLSMTDLV